MLRHRLTLGPILIAAIIALAWADQWLDGLTAPAQLTDFTGSLTFPPGIIAFVVIATLCVMAAREFARVIRSTGAPASMRINGALALAGLALAAFVPEHWSGSSGAALINASFGVVFAGALVVSSKNQRVEGMVAGAGGAVFAFAYLGLLMGFLIMIRREHPIWTLLWVILVTKSCDIGAFFTGTAIGKHKLIPWLSPGKTWEGLAGGVVTSGIIGGLGAWGLTLLTDQPVPGPLQGVLAGVVFGFVGQGGDLLASLLKRDAGIKDAGASLPGFGGVLDVIDSVALVGPVAFWMLWLMVGR